MGYRGGTFVSPTCDTSCDSILSVTIITFTNERFFNKLFINRLYREMPRKTNKNFIKWLFPMFALV